MEKFLNDIIEEVKKTNMNPEETKKYILAIKRVFRKAFDNCKDELKEEEIIEQCLDAYKKDIDFRGNANSIFNQMLMYTAYKNMLAAYKGNKAKFDQIIKEARRKENGNENENLALTLDSKQAMIAAVRSIIRENASMSEKQIIGIIQEEKSLLTGLLKDSMITVIQTSVAGLEEYGFIDEYIETSNAELEKLGLECLKFSKRNPIPDEQYEHGKLVGNTEDIGVIDTFSRENLEEMSLSELLMMTEFWELKYVEERMGISKGMSVIKTLDLWNVIFHGEDSDIQNLDNDKIVSALKKDLALTYLCKDGTTLTPKMKKQYQKFLKQNNIESRSVLEEDEELTKLEILNVSCAAADLAILECLLVHQLKEKEIKPKKWGIKGPTDTEEVELVIQSEAFRGPSSRMVLKTLILQVLGIDEKKLPVYDGKLDEIYSSIMCLPTNQVVKRNIKELYNKNPESELLANLAGKKVKKVNGDKER